MRPEGEAVPGGQVYVAAAGTATDAEGWKVIGTLVALEVTDDDLDEDSLFRWRETMRDAKLVNSFSVSTTFKFKLEGQLAYRRHLRIWFGIESPSLIHNGKKRRK